MRPADRGQLRPAWVTSGISGQLRSCEISSVGSKIGTRFASVSDNGPRMSVGGSGRLWLNSTKLAELRIRDPKRTESSGDRARCNAGVIGAELDPFRDGVAHGIHLCGFA